MHLPPGLGLWALGHRLGGRREDHAAWLATGASAPDEDTWVAQSGVRVRHLASPHEGAFELALGAAQAALAQAGVAAEEVGLIVVCTFSGDEVFPPLSARLQGALGAPRAQVFDLQANCVGFLTGLEVAASRLHLSPELGLALVVAVERHSPFAHPEDLHLRGTFSDGAGAALVGPVGSGRGRLGAAFHTVGEAHAVMRLGSREGHIEHDAAQSWPLAVTHLPATMRRACAQAELPLEAVDCFIFHQANPALMLYALQKLRQPVAKLWCPMEAMGNAGSASVAIAWSEAVAQGRLAEDQVVMIAAAAAGFQFGASLWRWGR